jgi:hypothetical protein
LVVCCADDRRAGPRRRRSDTATPQRPSIVNGQIAAALSGESGDIGFARRPSAPTLFVTPLMATHFIMDLRALAARCLYLDRLEETLTARQIEAQIEQFHSGVERRTPEDLPALGRVSK